MELIVTPDGEVRCIYAEEIDLTEMGHVRIRRASRVEPDTSGGGGCGATFRYVCGLYSQSHGAKCHHNTIEGQQAVRFVLSALRQKVLSPSGVAKLRQRLATIAQAQLEPADHMDVEVQSLRKRLEDTRAQLVRVGNNLAYAKTPEHFEEVTKVFDQLKAQEKQLTADVAGRERSTLPAVDTRAEVDAAMEVAYSLTAMSTNLDDLASAGKAFEAVNARLFLSFGTGSWGKRPVRKMTGGILTFGNEPPPIQLYNGPTARSTVKGGIDATKKA